MFLYVTSNIKPLPFRLRLFLILF